MSDSTENFQFFRHTLICAGLSSGGNTLVLLSNIEVNDEIGMLCNVVGCFWTLGLPAGRGIGGGPSQ